MLRPNVLSLVSPICALLSVASPDALRVVATNGPDMLPELVRLLTFIDAAVVAPLTFKAPLSVEAPLAERVLATIGPETLPELVRLLTIIDVAVVAPETDSVLVTASGWEKVAPPLLAAKVSAVLMVLLLVWPLGAN